MWLLIDTSTPVCRLTIARPNGEIIHEDSWNAGRDLSRELPKYLDDQLSLAGGNLRSLSGIAVNRGPGSFTGLRISISLLNTYAQALKIPIIGEIFAPNDENDDYSAWQQRCLERLKSGATDQLVQPHYGAQAHITQPKK